MAAWTPARAARLGFMAGRGASAATILADEAIGARSERAVRMSAARWGLSLGLGSPLAIPLQAGERLALTLAARARGMEVVPFAHLILRTVVRAGLIGAVLDDGKDAAA